MTIDTSTIDTSTIDTGTIETGTIDTRKQFYRLSSFAAIPTGSYRYYSKL